MTENKAKKIDVPYDANNPTVYFVVERDENQEALIKETQELSNKLEQVASIEFSKRAIAVGLDPSTATPDDLIIAESERKSNHEAPSGQSETETAYWNNSQVSGGSTYPSDSEGLPVSMLEAESPQELIQILNSRKDPDAKLALNKLITKVVKSGKGIN